MDWNYAIERNRDALKRVLAALVAMAGLAVAGPPLLPSGEKVAAKWPDEEGARPTLPRHLHRAVLRLLRPAEAAARRLVIVAAQGLVVDLPRLRARKPKQPPERKSKGLPACAVTGIWMPPQFRPQASRALPAARALPLFDPLPRMGLAKRKASGVPRLCLPGFSAPHPVSVRQHLGPDDRIDAARLALRLQALGRALDDLPREARRFARWRARGAVGAGAQNQNRDTAGVKGTRSLGRARRLWPLRPGRPLSVSRRAGLGAWAGHEVHEILQDAHSLAAQALETPDTS